MSTQLPSPPPMPMPPSDLEAGTALATVNTPTELLRLAIERDLAVDKLAHLMELQLRWEQNEARKAFAAAKHAFKSHPLRITKNQHVSFPTKDGAFVEYDYATLDHICEAIAARLSECGLDHCWKIDQNSRDLIKVTCVLTHKLGHQEEATLIGAPDFTGGKNAIQAVGSTVTYLQRYTLLAAVGLAAKGQDSDGRVQTIEANAGAGVAADRVTELASEITAAKNGDQLIAAFRRAYSEASAKKDQVAQKALIAAKDRRRRELAQKGGAR
jgi:ERF superfamily